MPEEFSGRADVVVPASALPGVGGGRARLQRALELLANPDAPGALDDARQMIADALEVIPQSGLHAACREFRWRMKMDVCSVRTCGRCAPLRAAAESVD